MNSPSSRKSRPLLARLNRTLSMRLLIVALSALLSYLFALLIQPEFALSAALIGTLTSAIVAAVVDRLVAKYRQIIRDQNQQLRLQNEELIAVNALLEESNAELQAFSYTVAHDIKSPIGAITLSADLLIHQSNMDVPDTAKIRHNSLRIATSSHHVADIVDELLLLANVNQAQIDLEPVNMAPIIQRATQRIERMLRERKGHIIIAQEWPAVRSYGPWLEEVWVNYLSNGLKYGGQPPHLELGVDLLPDEWARFWVRDNGPGIEKGLIPTLFTEFTQLADSRAEGSGLGLSIVHRIVHRLGGDVGVESQIGHGSLFFFTLPLA